MDVEVFSLCDAATVDAAGKLNVLGAFDTIFVTRLPAVYPYCAIALRLRFKAIERGQHKVSVNFVNQDGKPLLPAASGTVDINFPEGQRSGSANLVLNLQMLKLDNGGECAIDLAIDGRNEASLPLFIKERK